MFAGYVPLIVALVLCLLFSSLYIAVCKGALRGWVREASVIEPNWTLPGNHEFLALVVTPLCAYISGLAAILLFAEDLPAGMIRNGLALMVFFLFCVGGLVLVVGTAGRMMPALWLYPAWLRDHRQVDEDYLKGNLTKEQYLMERAKLGSARRRGAAV